MTYNTMRDFGNVCDQIKNPFRTKFGVLSFGEIIQTKIFFPALPTPHKYFKKSSVLNENIIFL